MRGSVLDVVVDIRNGSPTYGKSVSAVLSAENWNQILVPVGFAHGLCVIEDNTEVIYKDTNIYAPDHDCGILWSDPALGIEWPVSGEKALLSDKDRELPMLKDIQSPFDYNR